MASHSWTATQLTCVVAGSGGAQHRGPVHQRRRPGRGPSPADHSPRPLWKTMNAAERLQTWDYHHHRRQHLYVTMETSPCDQCMDQLALHLDVPFRLSLPMVTRFVALLLDMTRGASSSGISCTR